MKLPEELITVTPLSKTLAMILFLTLPFLGFVLGINYQQLIQDNTTRQMPVKNPIISKSQVKQSYRFIKANGVYLFIDNVYGYVMDFSSIPDATVTPGSTYDFDMYKPRPQIPATNDTHMILDGSVARFSISAPLSNAQGITLVQYAIQKLGYLKGKNNQNSYGGTEETSDIQQITLGTNNAVTWSTKTISNSYFKQDYLVSLKGKVVHLDMYSWNVNDFQTSLPAFQQIVASLDISK